MYFSRKYFPLLHVPLPYFFPLVLLLEFDAVMEAPVPGPEVVPGSTGKQSQFRKEGPFDQKPVSLVETHTW